MTKLTDMGYMEVNNKIYIKASEIESVDERYKHLEITLKTGSKYTHLASLEDFVKAYKKALEPSYSINED